MQDKLKNIMNDIVDKWKALKTKQKFYFVSTILVLILSIIIVSILATRPDWVVLVDKRSASEIAAIQSALTELGYPNRLAQNGTAVEVESKHKDQASVDLSTKNIPTEGAFTFEDALNLSGMGSTEMIKKASLKKAKESELSQGMLNFDGIIGATVSLAIPETNNYFIQNTENASASVMVKTTKRLDDAQAEAMARYIAAGVVGLTIEHIEIIDQEANTVFSGATKGNSFLGGQDEIVLKRKMDLENRIKLLYAPLYNDVKISSNLVFNWDTNKVVTRIVTPPIADSEVGLKLKENSEVQKVKNGNTDAQQGISANDQTAPEYNIGQTAPSSLDVKNNIIEYAYNEEERITEDSIGKLVPDQSSLVIAVYRYKEYDQNIVEKNNLLQNTTWEDYKAGIQTQEITIDPALIVATKNGTGIPESNISIIGFEVPIFVDKVIEPKEVGNTVTYAIALILVFALIYGVLKQTKPDEITEIEPELSVEDLLVSTQMEDEVQSEFEKLREIEFDKESESKRQIEKFVQEKPEAVAQLLRNWLNDEWE